MFLSAFLPTVIFGGWMALVAAMLWYHQRRIDVLEREIDNLNRRLGRVKDRIYEGDPSLTD